MRSLSSIFVHAITSIEEARDISKLFLDELSGSLQAHEAKIQSIFQKNTKIKHLWWKVIQVVAEIILLEKEEGIFEEEVEVMAVQEVGIL